MGQSNKDYDIFDEIFEKHCVEKFRESNCTLLNLIIYMKCFHDIFFKCTCGKVHFNAIITLYDFREINFLVKPLI